MASQFFQVFTGGILLGGIYGFAAFGLSITFGVLNILNLAHGDFLMLGSLVGYSIFLSFGINPFIIAILIIPLFVVIGVGFYLLLLKPISGKPPNQLLVASVLTASVLITLGASIVIEDLTSFFWPHPITGIDYSLPSLELNGLVVSQTRLFILLFLLILAISIQLYLQKTYMGSHCCLRRRFLHNAFYRDTGNRDTVNSKIHVYCSAGRIRQPDRICDGRYYFRRC